MVSDQINRISALPLFTILAGALGFIFVLFVPGERLFSDPDTLMHITSGQWILASGYVPTTDPFSFNTVGKYWVNHQWLAQTAMAWVIQYMGLSGLHFVIAALFGITLALEAFFLLKRIPPIYVFLLLVLCVFSLAGHLLVRPHLFTWPIMVLWFSVLFKTVEGAKKPPYWLALLMIPWANLHGSFILGLVLIPFFFLQAIYGQAKERRVGLYLPWALFLLLSGVFSLITPFGIDGLIFGAEHISSNYIKHIVEWAPASGFNFLPILFWMVLILSLSLLGAMRMSPPRFLLLIGLLYEAAMHVRYVSIFGLVVPLLLASPMASYFHSRSALKSSHPQLAPHIPMANRRLIYGIGACLLIVVAAVLPLSKQVVDNSSPAAIAPIEALNAARRCRAEGKVLNHYNLGGFLISQGVPVYVDGRADLYGNAFIADYFSLIHTSDNNILKKNLADKNIAWTIFPPDESILLYLDGQSDWKRIYADKFAVVHMKGKDCP